MPFFGSKAPTLRVVITPDLVLDFGDFELFSELSDIEIGIPVYRSLSRGIAKAVSLRDEYPHVAIHLSINGVDLKSLNRELRSKCESLKIKLTLFEDDIGLYGNFRYLALAAQLKFFAWLALDDKPCSPPWENAAAVADLVIPNFEYRAFDERDTSWSTDVKGLVPAASRANVFHNQFHGFLGLWRTEFLVSIFPKRDFDWLDTFLLDSAFLMGKVKMDGSRTQVLGWWPQSEMRTKNYTNGRYLNPNQWLVNSLRMIARVGAIHLFPRLGAGLVERIMRSKFDRARRKTLSNDLSGL